MARRVRLRDRVRPEWRFPLRFLALVAGLYALVSFFEPLRSGITRLVLLGVPAASSLFGVSGETSASGLTSFADGRFSYTVTYGCTGVSGIVLLVSAIGAYPSTRRYPIALRQRLTASLAAVVGLMLLNYVRLGALAWIGINAPDQFDAAHIYWFQGLTIVAVGLGWLAWVRLVVQRDPDARFAADPVRDLGRSIRRFAGVFAGLTTAGVLLGPDRLYAGSVGFCAWLLTPFVWGVDITRPEISGDIAAYLYGGLAALFALMVASPGTDVRQSLRRFCILAPVMFAAQVSALVAQLGIVVGGAGNNPLLASDSTVIDRLLALPLDLAIAPMPLILWFAWIERHPRPRTAVSRPRASRAPSNV